MKDNNLFLKMLALLVLVLLPTAGSALEQCELLESDCVRPPDFRNTFVDGVLVDKAWSISVTTSRGTRTIKTDKCPMLEQRYECLEEETVNNCTREQIQGCTLAKNECIKRRRSDGSCIEFAQHYVCPDRGQTTCQIPMDTDNLPANCGKSPSICTDTVGTTCVAEDFTVQCRAPADACNNNNNCQLVDTRCIAPDPVIPGQCAQVEQVYECQDQELFCAREGVQNTCTGVTTFGLEDQEGPGPQGEMGDVLAAMALADAIGKNIGGNPPRVFNGDRRFCTVDKTLAGIAAGLSAVGGGAIGFFATQAIDGALGLIADCCDRNVSVGDGTILTMCTADEERLGDQRRNNLTVFVDTECWEGVSAFGSCVFCSKERSYYCAFDSLLSRIVNEQGREQLADLAISNQAGAQTTTRSYTFFHGGTTQTNGRWTSAISVNNNHLKLWQWAGACDSDPQTTTTSLENVPCPTGNTTPVAICEGTAPGSCGSMPVPDPFGNFSTRNTEWKMLSLPVRSDSNKKFTLSKYVVVTPTNNNDFVCTENGNCNIAVHAFDSINGGSKTFNIDLNYPVRGGAQDHFGTPAIFGSFSVSGLTRAVDTPFDANTPPMIRYSYPGIAGTKAMTLPESIPANDPVTLPQTPVTVIGGCGGSTKNCNFTFSIPVNVQAKPFKTGENDKGDCKTEVHTDCSGFSVEQIQLLDFGKMDLSEFTASLEFEEQISAMDVTKAQDAINERKNEQRDAESPIEFQEKDKNEMEGRALAIVKPSRCQAIGQGENCTIQVIGKAEWPDAGGQPVEKMIVDWGFTATTLTTAQNYNGVPQFVTQEDISDFVTASCPDGFTRDGNKCTKPNIVTTSKQLERCEAGYENGVDDQGDPVCWKMEETTVPWITDPCEGPRQREENPTLRIDKQFSQTACVGSDANNETDTTLVFHSPTADEAEAACPGEQEIYDQGLCSVKERVEKPRNMICPPEFNAVGNGNQCQKNDPIVKDLVITNNGQPNVPDKGYKEYPIGIKLFLTDGSVLEDTLNVIVEFSKPGESSNSIVPF